jgi:hypothetical protein
MGLGQVRDLRQSAIAEIDGARAGRPFSDLRDLLTRVDLHPKEIRRLIQCGALDGLGAAAGVPFHSRAALLGEADLVPRSGKGNAVQLAFAFGEPDIMPESAGRRCAWETEALGLPVTALAEPLALLDDPQSLPEHGPLADLLADRRMARTPTAGRPVIGMRLPGWTGGAGFFLWDGRTLATARLPKAHKAPPTWQPLLVRGHRGGDGWGSWWLEVDDLRVLS